MSQAESGVKFFRNVNALTEVNGARQHMGGEESAYNILWIGAKLLR